MYSGIIYRYYLINEKGMEMSYIGQTCSEKQRKADFFKLSIPYGGKRIENARKKYGPTSFKYEILENVNEKPFENHSST